MDVSDRSTYIPSLQDPSLGSIGLEGPSRVLGDNPSTSDPTGTNRGMDFSELSSAARAVAQAMQMPEVRQERVASLQRQIASGNYHVAAQDVADAMARSLVG